MSKFTEMIAKAQGTSSNDGDYFFPNVNGIIDIQRLFQHNGVKGTSVILEATVVECKPSVEGARVHTPGSKVKKVYSLSKYPEMHHGMLKTDILRIMGIKEEDLSVKDMEALLGEIFEDSKSPGFELRGYRAAFSSKESDRSAKGKSPITSTYFKNVPNPEAELSARKAAVDARLSGAKA